MTHRGEDRDRQAQLRQGRPKRPERAGARACAWGLSAILSLIALGCGGATSRVPPEDAARAALEAALDSWRRGAKAGQVQNPPAGVAMVRAVDSDWSAGKKLAAYEIVGQAGDGAGPVRIDVKLTLRNQPPRNVTYYVVGREPLWVFRDKDYQQHKGM